MAAQGMVEVEGLLDLAQFWPHGLADADATTISVDVKRGIRFRPHRSAPFRVTHAFAGATVHGRATRLAISRKGKMAVRLQGVDAPELHYRARPLVRVADRTKEQHRLFKQWSFQYRQHCAESSMVALMQYLHRETSNDVVRCVVRSRVDAPSDVFDTYGRLVGDVLVRLGRRLVNVGDWLLESGRALPCLYDSMSRGEMNRASELATEAWRRGRGLWRQVVEQIPRFNFGLRFRRSASSVEADSGELVLPKVFRRQVVWAINQRSKMFEGPLLSYLRDALDATRAPDTSALLPAPLSEVTSLVLRESPSRLLRGQRFIRSW